jgi:hypothetical protein
METETHDGLGLGAQPCSAVLFLDFDGVLNSCNWFQKSRRDNPPDPSLTNEEGMIDPEAVANLNRILEATGCDVVISSTWRRGHTMGELLRLLVKRGMDKAHWDKFVGKTPVLDGKLPSGLFTAVVRGHEIQAWLDENPGYDRIAILDDDGDMAHLVPRLVLTHGIEGLNTEKVDEAICLLNVQEQVSRPTINPTNENE